MHKSGLGIPIFDGHNDTLTNLYRPERSAGRTFFERSNSGQIDLPRAKEGGLAGGIFAIFTPAPEGSPERDPMHGLTFTEGGYDVTHRSPLDYLYAHDFTHSVINFLYDLETEGAGEIAIARSSADLERNLHEGVLSIVLLFEGAEAIREDLGDLEEFYALGLRALGPVWSRPNAFGDGVPFRFPGSPDTGEGLTAAGKKLVRECNRLGIMLDLTHLNERGFWDVARTSGAPLVVSHAGVHAICPSTRNLTDEQIDAIGRSGGLVGVIFEPLNTRPDGGYVPATPLTEIVSHIDYIAQRVGIDHVALGSDFDGADMPDDLPDAASLPGLISLLRERGYNRESLEKIAYRNWFRVLEACWS